MALGNGRNQTNLFCSLQGEYSKILQSFRVASKIHSNSSKNLSGSIREWFRTFPNSLNLVGYKRWIWLISQQFRTFDTWMGLVDQILMEAKKSWNQFEILFFWCRNVLTTYRYTMWWWLFAVQYRIFNTIKAAIWLMDSCERWCIDLEGISYDWLARRISLRNNAHQRKWLSFTVSLFGCE